jgi:hypothetical protein
MSCFNHAKEHAVVPNENKEEEKKSEESNKPQYPHLPCFDLPEFSQIWCNGKIQFKKETKIEEGKQTTIEGEWLDGKPHGICIFEDEI